VQNLLSIIAMFFRSKQCCQVAEILAAKQKGDEKIVWGRVNLGANILADLSKRAQKPPNFFVFWFCSKTVVFLVGNCNFPSV
jgi:hypothetical protein